MCTLDKNAVFTFDNRLYPVTLGACKHVLLTTYPRQDPDSNRNHMTIPEKMRVAILAEDADDNSKSVIIFMGNREVKLVKLDNRLKAIVDGGAVELSQFKSYQYRQDDEIVYQIVQLPDQSIEVTSNKYGFSAVYDGERVQIVVSKTISQTGNIKSIIIK